VHLRPVVFSPRQTAKGLVYTDGKMLPPPPGSEYESESGLAGAQSESKIQDLNLVSYPI